MASLARNGGDSRLFLFRVLQGFTVLWSAHFSSSWGLVFPLAVVREISMLLVLPVAEPLAERLLIEGVIPPAAADDATRLGFAAAHHMDFLLTWNCRPINNRALQRRIEQACAACWLPCPVICTPAELMNA